jgi:division protein CdvB (Snf7/Vps24/ESCRT-III family)
MAREVTPDQVDALFEDLSYPILRIDAAREFADVTLQFAEDEANLGELVSETKNDAFDSIDDLETELREVIPDDAVEFADGVDSE